LLVSCSHRFAAGPIRPVCRPVAGTKLQWPSQSRGYNNRLGDWGQSLLPTKIVSKNESAPGARKLLRSSLAKYSALGM